MAVSQDTQREVQEWREHLDVLNETLPPVEPPKHIWKTLRKPPAKRILLVQPEILARLCFCLCCPDPYRGYGKLPVSQSDRHGIRLCRQ